MSELVKKTTHYLEALARLLEQFKNKPRIYSLIESLIEPVQDLEDVTFDYVNGRGIEDAIGAQLDILGELVGQERLAFDDTEYRLWIQARVLVNRSNGRPDEILRILEIVLPDTAVYELTELYPASFRVDLFNYADPQIIFGIVTEARGAAIGFDLVYSDLDASLIFEWAPGNTLVTGDNNKGFGNTAQTTGGRLAGVVSV